MGHPKLRWERATRRGTWIFEFLGKSHSWTFFLPQSSFLDEDEVYSLAATLKRLSAFYK